MKNVFQQETPLREWKTSHRFGENVCFFFFLSHPESTRNIREARASVLRLAWWKLGPAWQDVQGHTKNPGIWQLEATRKDDVRDGRWWGTQGLLRRWNPEDLVEGSVWVGTDGGFRSCPQLLTHLPWETKDCARASVMGGDSVGQDRVGALGVQICTCWVGVLRTHPRECPKRC